LGRALREEFSRRTIGNPEFIHQPDKFLMPAIFLPLFSFPSWTEEN
jgi:hypothetical protein